MKSKFYSLAVLLAATGAMAQAEVLTFDDLPTGQMANGGSVTEGSFTLTSVGTGDPGNYVTFVNVGAPNNNVFVDGNNNDVFGTQMAITLTGGGTFDLNSLDVADLSNSGGAFVFCGSGFRIEVTSNVGGCADYGPGTSTFTTETPGGFTGLTELDINIVSLGTNFAVDNVVLTPDAPEPSTVLLSLTGLAGLAWKMRRRKSTEQ